MKVLQTIETPIFRCYQSECIRWLSCYYQELTASFGYFTPRGGFLGAGGEDIYNKIETIQSSRYSGTLFPFQSNKSEFFTF